MKSTEENKSFRVDGGSTELALVLLVEIIRGRASVGGATVVKRLARGSKTQQLQKSEGAEGRPGATPSGRGAAKNSKPTPGEQETAEVKPQAWMR